MLLQTLFFLLSVVFIVNADPVVRPETQQLQSPASGVVKSVFATPLTACFIRVSDHHSDLFDRLLNFTSGAGSPSFATRSGFNASFAGGRLDPEGHCGVKVNMKRFNILLVEFFGRTQGGQWDRGFGTITAHPNKVMPVSSTTPLLQLGAPGGNLSVLLHADRQLTYCHIETPHEGFLDLSPGLNPRPDRRYQAHGAGPHNRECGVTLVNLQDRDAGVWRISAFNEVSSHVVYQITVVLVQAAPVGDPVLTIQDQDSLAPGKLLEAKCVAPSAVPHANLTWLLGGHVVRQDKLNDTLTADVGTSRPWDRQPMHQTFRHLITATDMGQVLECRMTHMTLAGPRTVGLEIPIKELAGMDLGN